MMAALKAAAAKAAEPAPPPPPEEYAVGAILGKKKIGGEVHYQVRTIPSSSALFAL